MNNNQPVLHLSLYVDCSPSQKRELRKLLSNYTKRADQWSLTVGISFDSYNERMEKQIQQEMLYYVTKTNCIQEPLTTTRQIYMTASIIIDYASQCLYDNNHNPKSEDWMLLSFTHSEKSQHMYNIEWTIGIESCNDYSSYY